MLITFDQFPYSPEDFINMKENEVIDFNGIKFFLAKSKHTNKISYEYHTINTYKLFPVKNIYACSTITISNSEIFKLSSISWKKNSFYSSSKIYETKIKFKKIRHSHDSNRSFTIEIGNKDIFFISNDMNKCQKELETYRLLT